MRSGTKFAFYLATLAALSELAGCGGSHSPAPPMPTPSLYAVGGSISGIIPVAGNGSQLVLEDNGTDALYLNANGAFHFSHPLSSGSAFNVTIAVGPVDPPESCTVTHGTGQAGPTSVSAVFVNCSLAKFTVGGTVSGLKGPGLVLTDNGGDALPISANGTFTFATPVTTGSSYEVGVQSQPPGQTCLALSYGDGDIFRSPVTNVSVVCADNVYTVGVSVTGLLGTGLLLELDSSYAGTTDTALPPTRLTLNANGISVFSPLFAAQPTPHQPSYQVSVVAQPSSPAQTCVVDDREGFIAGASVTLSVVCSTPRIAYGAGGHGNNVLAYAIDESSGALTALAGSPYPSGDSTNAIAADPLGRFIFAANQGATGGAASNTVSAFTIDSVTGGLHAVAGSPFAAPTAPIAIVVEPSGRFAYVANYHDNTVAAYTINAMTGALSSMAGGPTEAGVDGPRYLSVHPNGKFLYLSVGNEASIWAYSIDPASGALTAVAGSPFVTPRGPGPLLISPNGLYGAFDAQSAINGYVLGSVVTQTIDPNTGALSVSGSFISSMAATALAVEPGFNFAYAIDQPQSGNGLLVPYTIMNSEGFVFGAQNEDSASPDGISYPFSSAVSTITADPSGRFVYVVDSGGAAHAFIIDPVTGNLNAGAVTTGAFSAQQPLLITRQ